MENGDEVESFNPDEINNIFDLLDGEDDEKGIPVFRHKDKEEWVLTDAMDDVKQEEIKEKKKKYSLLNDIKKDWE